MMMSKLWFYVIILQHYHSAALKPKQRTHLSTDLLKQNYTLHAGVYYRGYNPVFGICTLKCQILLSETWIIPFLKDKFTVFTVC